MSDQELADGTARAMGWTLRESTPPWVDNLVLRAWFNGQGHFVFQRDWCPATDWRDTGVVLEWLHERSHLVGLRQVFASNDRQAFATPRYQAGRIATGNGDTIQRAICLAAIEVGREQ